MTEYSKDVSQFYTKVYISKGKIMIIYLYYVFPNNELFFIVNLIYEAPLFINIIIISILIRLEILLCFSSTKFLFYSLHSNRNKR